jgi:curved DNA-binding protein CbpA
VARTFDPYRALGVRRDANEADVKAAHRKLAKRFHPDAADGDTGRFLDVQEAYRVLSDPLLRREWDARHAPGPIRADSPEPAPRREPRAKREPRAPEPATRSQTSAQGTAPDASAGPADEPDNRRPRSSRAYTWSAAEVPWWEEGTNENRRQRRPPAADAGPQSSRPAPTGSVEPPADAPNPFDVYNRSSGAAWSMAARAYFRRGDQELPRRGTFHYEGTQVLTGARARAAAETEARRRKAQQTREHGKASSTTSRGGPGGRAGAGATAAGSTAAGSTAAGATAAGAATARKPYAEAGVARDVQRIQRMRATIRRRAAAATWPSLRERLLYALLAWVPAAIVIGYGGAAATGCDRGSLSCPAYLETAQAVAIALLLGAFVALPKIAYIGAMAAAGALLVGLVVVGFMAFAGVELPLPTTLTAALGATMLIAYLVSGAAVLLRNSSARPWSPGAGT